MRRTIDEFAEELGVSREAAEGLVRYLRETKLVRFRGERTPEHGMGKGAHVYSVVGGAGSLIGRAIRKLEP